MRTLALLVAVVAIAAPRPSHACAGDIDGDGSITVDEVLLGVGAALGGCARSSPCPGDINGDGETTIDEILTMIDSALNGCADGTPTPTATRAPSATRSQTGSPTQTGTPTPSRTPTTAPPRCPNYFTTNGGTPCVFVGRINDTCGETYRMAFVSDGRIVVFVMGVDQDTRVLMGGNVIFSAKATISLWGTKSDFSDAQPMDADATLSDRAAILNIVRTGASFTLNHCPFERFSGAYEPPARISNDSEIARAAVAALSSLEQRE